MKNMINRILMVFVFVVVLPAALVVGAASVIIGLWKSLLGKAPEIKNDQSIS
jgi:hypothetical protein